VRGSNIGPFPENYNSGVGLSTEAWAGHLRVPGHPSGRARFLLPGDGRPCESPQSSPLSDSDRLSRSFIFSNIPASFLELGHFLATESQRHGGFAGHLPAPSAPDPSLVTCHSSRRGGPLSTRHSCRVRSFVFYDIPASFLELGHFLATESQRHGGFAGHLPALSALDPSLVTCHSSRRDGPPATSHFSQARSFIFNNIPASFPRVLMLLRGEGLGVKRTMRPSSPFGAALAGPRFSAYTPPPAPPKDRLAHLPTNFNGRSAPRARTKSGGRWRKSHRFPRRSPTRRACRVRGPAGQAPRRSTWQDSQLKG
jgi:hypothetical protein